MLFQGVDLNDHCSWCHYLSCVPTSHWSCNSQRGFCEVTDLCAPTFYFFIFFPLIKRFYVAPTYAVEYTYLELLVSYGIVFVGAEWNIGNSRTSEKWRSTRCQDIKNRGIALCHYITEFLTALWSLSVCSNLCINHITRYIMAAVAKPAFLNLACSP